MWKHFITLESTVTSILMAITLNHWCLSPYLSEINCVEDVDELMMILQGKITVTGV
jgi:hypothetical protein